MPLKILCWAGRVNGVELARETQAPPGKPVSNFPSEGKGFELTGTQHSCFGNCAEFSLNVSKRTWILAVLVCRPKDLFTAMQDAIA